MAFTKGVTKIIISNIESITVFYLDKKLGASANIAVPAANIEQGASLGYSAGSNIVVGNGANVVTSEKVVISFTVLADTIDLLNIWKSKLNNRVDYSINSIYFTLADGTVLTVNYPYIMVDQAVKTNDVFRVKISVEVNGGDADSIIVIS